MIQKVIINPLLYSHVSPNGSTEYQDCKLDHLVDHITGTRIR